MDPSTNQEIAVPRMTIAVTISTKSISKSTKYLSSNLCKASNVTMNLAASPKEVSCRRVSTLSRLNISRYRATKRSLRGTSRLPGEWAKTSPMITLPRRILGMYRTRLWSLRGLTWCTLKKLKPKVTWCIKRCRIVLRKYKIATWYRSARYPSKSSRHK